MSKGDVVIGNDVWLGANATVLSGVTIGDGAVVAANAVVPKNVPPYGIVAGNPAKLVRYRFSPEIIAQLLEVQWWHWPDEKVRAFVPLLLSDRIEDFLEAALGKPLTASCAGNSRATNKSKSGKSKHKKTKKSQR